MGVAPNARVPVLTSVVPAFDQDHPTLLVLTPVALCLAQGSRESRAPQPGGGRGNRSGPLLLSRRAIGVLANRGLVIRRHGIGTLVVPVRVRRPVRLSSLYDDLTQSGQAPTTRLLAYEVVPAPLEVANSLQLSRGTRVLHFERLRLATGQPISLMRNFLPLALKEVVTEEGLKLTGLYRLLRQTGIHLRLASQSIGARNPQPREARLLKVVKTAPLLTMRRISYDDAGQPVEYGSHVYPAERYSFEMSVVADSRT